jgi:hypothetical protein
MSRVAQGIEAQRAETAGLGSREPGGDSHAPNPGPLTNQDGGEKQNPLSIAEKGAG